MAYYVELSQAPRYHPTIVFEDQPPPGLFRFDYLKDGERASPDEVPQHVRVTSTHKRVSDVFAIKWYWGVRQNFKDLVERLEPGLHQFFQVELRYRTGAVEEGALFIFNICRSMDGLLFDESDLSWSSTGRPIMYPFPGMIVRGKPLGLLVHDKAAIAGCHVWRGGRLGSTKVFFSEALYDEFVREKLKKLTAYQTLEK
jgi:hypothetical protein